MIAIVDYKKGNIRSVERAFMRAGAEVVVTDEPAVLQDSDAIVLPGVGAFADAMATLNDSGLTDAIKSEVRVGKPFLGICLGQHLMFEGGLEHASDGNPVEGIGILEGIVQALPKTDDEGRTYKIPHVGWNTIEEAANGAIFEDHPLLRGIDSGEFFYFTHSYAVPSTDADVAYTTHSVTFPSVVGRGSAFGVQFHPEKSSDAGAQMIQNFVDYVREVS